MAYEQFIRKFRLSKSRGEYGGFDAIQGVWDCEE